MQTWDDEQERRQKLWTQRGGIGRHPWVNTTEQRKMSDKTLDNASMDEWTKAAKVVSDGGSSKYYEVPEWATELDDLIVHKKMPWHIANIFKACYRWGEKDGNDMAYEANKIQWFATTLQTHIKEGRYT